MPGEDEPLLAARHHGDLDEQHVAADRRPGQARGHAGTGGPLGHLVEEARAAQVLHQVVGGDRGPARDGPRPAGGPPCGPPRRSRARGCARRPRACSPGRSGGWPRARTTSSSAARPWAASCLGIRYWRRDPDLLLVRVPGQRQDLHPVAQRPGDGVERVGGGDEQHLGEVEGHAQVVVDEGVVLGGIEHLEQRRGGVAPPVGADLVDLVEHEDGIARLGPPQPLDDAAGQRADVRPPMAADLRLVPHAAQRHAHEPPAQRPGDALAEAGLAHAGRPHEAEDRLARRTCRPSRAAARRARWLCRRRLPGPACALLPELLDGQVLEDAVLDLLEVVVVLVQDLRGPGGCRWCRRPACSRAGSPSTRDR